MKIGRDIVGGDAENAGLIQTNGKLTSVTIGGSLIGGAGDYAGAISAKELGPVRIIGSVVGGYTFI